MPFTTAIAVPPDPRSSTKLPVASTLPLNIASSSVLPSVITVDAAATRASTSPGTGFSPVSSGKPALVHGNAGPTVADVVAMQSPSRADTPPAATYVSATVPAASNSRATWSLVD